MLMKVSDGLEIYRQGKPIYEGTYVPQTDLELPAVILHMAKYPHNVGQAIRILSCYNAKNLWITGNRCDLKPYDGYRLPREERMKGYGEVVLYNYHDPLSAILESRPEAVPVAVEITQSSENLPHFEHPENAVYIFGPEDGSLPGSLLKRCHRFVKIPTRHCLNLATAVGTVLYDRTSKLCRE